MGGTSHLRSPIFMAVFSRALSEAFSRSPASLQSQKQPAPVSPVLFVWHVPARADRDLVFQDSHALLSWGLRPS